MIIQEPLLSMVMIILKFKQIITIKIKLLNQLQNPEPDFIQVTTKNNSRYSLIPKRTSTIKLKVLLLHNISQTLLNMFKINLQTIFKNLTLYKFQVIIKEAKHSSISLSKLTLIWIKKFLIADPILDPQKSKSKKKQLPENYILSKMISNMKNMKTQIIPQRTTKK